MRTVSASAMILKLKRAPVIFVVGFMACGKSTVSGMLAERLGWHFLDLDQEIEKEQGAAIAEIFRHRGEAEFRCLETEAIRARVHLAQSGNPVVIALGGGAFLQPENFELIISNGVTVWLDCPLDVLRKRAACDATRPLASDPEQFERLYASRRPGYARADYRIDTTGMDADQVTEAVLALPIF
jgi:shikimate kinase